MDIALGVTAGDKGVWSRKPDYTGETAIVGGSEEAGTNQVIPMTQTSEKPVAVVGDAVEGVNHCHCHCLV